MVGSSVVRKLKSKGFKKILTIPKKKLDLLDQKKINNFLKKTKPEVVICSAGKVGGIYANNNHKAEFIYENLTIQTNLIHAAFTNRVKNFIFLGSSCVYPRLCKQPIKETYLLSGALEKTNDAYAIAKIAGIKMCEEYRNSYNVNYFTLMPSNLYGPNDNYNEKNSHFIPALIRKAYECKKKNLNKLIVWGSGKPKREVMFVDDLADACIFFLKKKPKHSLINIGTGIDRSIIFYAKTICKIFQINPKFIFDKSKPDGTPKKCMNVNLAKSYGWHSKTNLRKGLEISINDFINKNN